MSLGQSQSAGRVSWGAADLMTGLAAEAASTSVVACVSASVRSSSSDTAAMTDIAGRRMVSGGANGMEWSG